jgi:hypothetical protein
MAPSTLPPDAPDLMHVSDFRRYLQPRPAADARRSGRDTHLNTLPTGLRQDLLRFEQAGSRGELLDVMAAALRHGRALLVHLALADRVIPVTLFPHERLMHSPLTPDQWARLPLAALAVLQVEPALMPPPDPQRRLARLEAAQYGPLSVLGWNLALGGARASLLPELRGHVAYRVTRGANLTGLEMPAPLQSAVRQLRRQPAGLDTVAGWPGLGPEPAARLLNGLYLQSALIVSRAHPAAGSRWFGASWSFRPSPPSKGA